MKFVPTLLAAFVSVVAASPAPVPEPEPLLGLPHIPLVDALLALGASPPPPILQTPNKSPECAAINQGELMCCRGTRCRRPPTRRVPRCPVRVQPESQ